MLRNQRHGKIKIQHSEWFEDQRHHVQVKRHQPEVHRLTLK